MKELVQYNVEINCEPCPAGQESQIMHRLRSAFPVAVCRRTDRGLALRIDARHPVADGALKDFADLTAETLTALGIRMTDGVVRRVTWQTPGNFRVLERMQRLAAALTGLDAYCRLAEGIATLAAARTGLDLRPVREIPVLYFYKGLRFDLDLSARLRGMQQIGQGHSA